MYNASALSFFFLFFFLLFLRARGAARFFDDFMIARREL